MRKLEKDSSVWNMQAARALTDTQTDAYIRTHKHKHTHAPTHTLIDGLLSKWNS